MLPKLGGKVFIMLHKILTPAIDIPYNVDGKTGVTRKFVAVAYDEVGEKQLDVKRLDVFKLAPSACLPPVNTFCELYFDQFTRVSKIEVISPHGKEVKS